MVTRIKVECRTCHRVFALRIQRSPGRQAFVLACPYCRTQIQAVLTDLPNGDGHIESEDFDQLSSEAAADLAVAVSTEVPVHESAIGEPLRVDLLTPYIRLTSTVGTAVAYALQQRVDFARDMRERAFPYIRRALSFLIRDDLTGVTSSVRELQTIFRHLPADPVRALGVCLTLSYLPFEDRPVFRAARREFINAICDARSANRSGYNALLAAFDAGPLPAHSGRVFDSTITVLDDTGALFPSLWALAIVERGLPIDEYRVTRNDFDSIKVRYQDLFELASRGLVFAASIKNLGVRGDPACFVDGQRRTLNRALNNTRAVDRESWLAEFPAAKVLYENMQRHMRNHIGHRLVRYDFTSGTVVDDDGAETNYLLFLADYLHAVRLLHLLAESALLLRPDSPLRSAPYAPISA